MFEALKLLGVTVSAGFLGVLVPPPANATEFDQSNLRAAIIFNILRFTEFGSSQKNVVLCVEPHNPLAKALQNYHGKNLSGGKQLVVKAAQRITTQSGCSAAYIGELPRDRIIANPPRGVLLIGEGPNVIRGGGTIALVRFGRQIGFEINLQAGNEAGVRFSSHLLRLARNVKD